MKILKMIGLGIVGLILLLSITTMLVVSFAPQFGKSYGKASQENYEKLDNYEKGKFENYSETKMELKLVTLLQEQFKKDPSRSPAKEIEPLKLDSLEIENRKGKGTFLSWMGHSAFLLEMDGKKILIDPMLGNSPAPFDFLGPSRYFSDLAIEIQKIPQIDFVVISHDHYDHLDYGSIKKLKDKVGKFFVPLGIGAHLEFWGVSKDKIQEFNWWDETEYDGIQLAFTPSRHFSGRAILDRNKTLWGSWVIEGKKDKIFFSGDGGYDTHFKDIGEKYGPFDLALMECGQYHEQWKLIHMMPEDIPRAVTELKAKIFMPIHWGAFTLALHSWIDPVVRVSEKAKELDVPITTPAIGQTFEVGNGSYPNGSWWTKYLE